MCEQIFKKESTPIQFKFFETQKTRNYFCNRLLETLNKTIGKLFVKKTEKTKMRNLAKRDIVSKISDSKMIRNTLSYIEIHDNIIYLKVEKAYIFVSIPPRKKNDIKVTRSQCQIPTFCQVR